MSKQAKPEKNKPQEQAAPTPETAMPPLSEGEAAFKEAAMTLESVVGNELSALKEENAKLKDQLMRALAEVDNMRKRTEREVDDANKYAITSFARELIAVLENLHRAESALPEGEQREGVTLTRKELEKAFDKHGIKRMDPAGQKFDHNFHQAVAQVEDANAEAGTILQVLQAGYVIRDRLLRPAIVTVSKGPAAPRAE